MREKLFAAEKQANELAAKEKLFQERLAGLKEENRQLVEEINKMKSDIQMEKGKVDDALQEKNEQLTKKIQ